MTKKQLGFIAVTGLLAAALYFAAAEDREANRQPKPAGETVVLPAPPAAPKAETVLQAPEPADERAAGRLELAPDDKKMRPADSAGIAAGVSYSLKKESEREILPGVTVNSGNKGVSIKLPKPDETIKLTRGGDANLDYQVMWQKKY